MRMNRARVMPVSRSETGGLKARIATARAGASSASGGQGNAKWVYSRGLKGRNRESMSSFVFFRAVNVGGHQKFQPGKLADDLAEFDVLNFGAAGTFLVRGNVNQTRLRDAILRRLPFKPELMICPGREVLAMAHGDWFPATSKEKDLGRFVSVLQKVPRTKPSLPIEVPAGPKWEVRLVAVSGPFVSSIRRLGETYSNAVVEKHFALPATTRNWNTIEKICAVLEK